MTTETMTTETMTTEPLSPVRASDAEREETVARLHDALGAGRLDLAETEERVAAAYAAQYRADLAPLLADLPDASDTPSSAVPTWGALWTSAVWRARTALWGPAGPTAAPTGRESRIAAVLVVLAVLWMIVWAFVGAAVVG
jgi:hypothetical protein